jgi:transcriptional regulator with XRE-family HTH domain
MKRIGATIKALRKMKKVTQVQLGEVLHVSPQAVCKWEQELNDPEINLLPAIAGYFGVTIDYLFTGEEIEGIGARVDYSKFLFAMLLKDTTTVEYETMEYDRLFVKAQELYKGYDASESNDAGQPEYECMISYLQETILGYATDK